MSFSRYFPNKSILKPSVKFYPTLVEKMHRISKKYGCGVYVKRDDLINGNSCCGTIFRTLNFLNIENDEEISFKGVLGSDDLNTVSVFFSSCKNPITNENLYKYSINVLFPCEISERCNNEKEILIRRFLILNSWNEKYKKLEFSLISGKNGSYFEQAAALNNRIMMYIWKDSFFHKKAKKYFPKIEQKLKGVISKFYVNSGFSRKVSNSKLLMSDMIGGLDAGFELVEQMKESIVYDEIFIGCSKLYFVVGLFIGIELYKLKVNLQKMDEKWMKKLDNMKIHAVFVNKKSDGKKTYTLELVKKTIDFLQENLVEDDENLSSNLTKIRENIFEKLIITPLDMDEIDFELSDEAEWDNIHLSTTVDIKAMSYMIKKLEESDKNYLFWITSKIPHTQDTTNHEKINHEKIKELIQDNLKISSNMSSMRNQVYLLGKEKELEIIKNNFSINVMDSVNKVTTETIKGYSDPGNKEIVGKIPRKSSIILLIVKNEGKRNEIYTPKKNDNSAWLIENCVSRSNTRFLLVVFGKMFSQNHSELLVMDELFKKKLDDTEEPHLFDLLKRGILKIITLNINEKGKSEINFEQLKAIIEIRNGRFRKGSFWIPKEMKKCVAIQQSEYIILKGFDVKQTSDIAEYVVLSERRNVNLSEPLEEKDYLIKYLQTLVVKQNVKFDENFLDTIYSTNKKDNQMAQEFRGVLLVFLKIYGDVLKRINILPKGRVILVIGCKEKENTVRKLIMKCATLFSRCFGCNFRISFNQKPLFDPEKSLILNLNTQYEDFKKYKKNNDYFTVDLSKLNLSDWFNNQQEISKLVGDFSECFNINFYYYQEFIEILDVFCWEYFRNGKNIPKILCRPNEIEFLIKNRRFFLDFSRKRNENIFLSLASIGYGYK